MNDSLERLKPARDEFQVTYRMRATRSEITSRAEALLLEQTVELPRALLRDEVIINRCVGTVESVEPLCDEQFRVVFKQPVSTIAGDPA